MTPKNSANPNDDFDSDDNRTSPNFPLLNALKSPKDLKNASIADLEEYAREIREVICRVSEKRGVHLASNLGVVELTLALHYSFDFSWDRLVWDVGHQCYPHKIITGRFDRFDSLRTRGGLSGYPNPEESEYDLFMTGHAGCSVGAALGLALGDALRDALVETDLKESREVSQNAVETSAGDSLLPKAANGSRRTTAFKASEPGVRSRYSVAVVGDGAFSSGPIFEALNHAGELQRKLLVILNDNKMSICKRVGGFGRYLDHLRMTPSYLGVKTRVRRVVENLPNAYAFVSRLKDAIKTGLIGGALFEDLGFRYVGPINGHDFPTLIKYFEAIKTVDGPVLLHVLTEKGRGFPPAEIEPQRFHSSSPSVMRREKGAARRREKLIGRPIEDDRLTAKVDVKSVDDAERPFTYWAQRAVTRLLRDDPRVCVIVAAMTQGNMLEEARAQFPDRFFDVGICEAHAVNFAAGLAKAGMRPIVDIYSGFLQRAYDHLFQETSLQNLPIIFSLDRAGLVGADGATHHGVFDLSYLRPFPNMTVLAPLDSLEMDGAFDFAIASSGPVAIRYPKTKSGRVDRDVAPYRLGKAEVLSRGVDGAVVVCGGGLVDRAIEAADRLRASEDRLDVGIINARFVKPLDSETILAPLRDGGALVSVEENALLGGFGSAVLEAANDEGVDTRAFARLGVPDAYIPHGTREEELSDAGLDVENVVDAIRRACKRRSTKG